MSVILEALHKAVAGENLSEAQAEAALGEILGGEAPAPLVSALLVALRMKGETVDEVVGFARALRASAERVDCGADPRPLVDTAGTGGDGSQTFNISTASAFVAAGAGARVAKHGNRSISSRCGSADVVEELGVQITLPPARIAQCVREVGIGFLFAPALHPAMRHVQPVRALLKMRTIFNLLGPLVNPAGAEAQVVGVFDPRLVRLLAQAMVRLGVGRGLVVHGGNGLDEITTTGPTMAVEVKGDRLTERVLRPEDFGLDPAAPEDLAGGDRQQNAAILRSVLAGERGPRRDVVLANAAAALVTAGLAPDLLAGMDLARSSIDSGRASEKLAQLVRLTSGTPNLAPA